MERIVAERLAEEIKDYKNRKEVVPAWKLPPNERFQFSEEFFLKRTPSRLKAGFTYEQETEGLQALCTFIQGLGGSHGVSQLCINTACQYLRRIYCFLDLKHYSKSLVASACFFLACKQEECPRKMESIARTRIKMIRTPEQQHLKPTEGEIQAGIQEITMMEMVVLKLLGFDLTIDQPHTHVVRGCQLFKATKDFAQTAYFLATNSLHLTNMCVMYPPSTVACVCIHLASKWAHYTIPKSIEDKDWFQYIDPTLTQEKLLELSGKLLDQVMSAPQKYKRTQLIRQGNIDNRKRPHPGAAPGQAGPSGQQAGPSGQPGPSRALARPAEARAETARREEGEPTNKRRRPGEESRPPAPVKEEDKRGDAHHDHHHRPPHPHHHPHQGKPGQDPHKMAAPPGRGGDPTSQQQLSGAHNMAPPPGVKQEPVEKKVAGLHPSQSMPNLSAERPKISLAAYHKRQPAPTPNMHPHASASHLSGPVNMKTEAPERSKDPSRAKMEMKAMKLEQQQQQQQHASASLHPPNLPPLSLGSGSKKSPMKGKKEGGKHPPGGPMILKEPLITLTDLRDTSGPVFNMYTSAQRRNSTDIEVVGHRQRGRSESESRPGEPARPESREKGESHRSRKDKEKSKHRSAHSSSSRSSKTASGEEDSTSSPAPIPKIKLKVLPPLEDSRGSSPLKMKIKCMPEQPAAPTPQDQSQGLKMKFNLSASGQFKQEDGRGKHKSSSSSSHHQSQSQSRSSRNPPQATSVFGSDKQQFSSRGRAESASRPTLKTQHSGFSFPDSMTVPSTLPDMIFEPDTPTDLNGGMMPTTPTPDNMHYVSAMQQQLYTQHKNRQHQQAPYGMMGHHQPHNPYHMMFPPPPPSHALGQHPPLPPPLPDNPPPPPPPPPQ